MTDLDTLRRQAAAHDDQLAAVRWLTVQDLAARWGVSEASVRRIPRTALPYLAFGASQMRRYKPEDVVAFEESRKPTEDSAA